MTRKSWLILGAAVLVLVLVALLLPPLFGISITLDLPPAAPPR